MKSKEEFSLKRLLELYCVLIIIAAFSFIANLNIVLCIVINLLLPSLLVYLHTDNFAPKGYFLYVMTFVLLELRPIQFSDLPRRFIVLSFGMSVVTIALLINSLIRKQKNNYESAQLGLLNVSGQLKKLANREQLSGEVDELSRIINDLNNRIYSSRNFKYLVDSSGSNNYYFMLVFQKFQYVINDINTSIEELNEQDIAYLSELSELLKRTSEEINTEDNLKLIKQVDEFIVDKNVTNQKTEYDITYILNLLKIVLSNMTNANFEAVKESWRIPKKTHKIHGIRYNLKLDRFQLRFAYYEQL